MQQVMGSTAVQLYDHRDRPFESNAILERAVADQGAHVYYLQERLAELELALEDQGWKQLAVGGEKEFSRAGLRTIINMSRLMYIKNPLIKQGVNVQARYVFGRGVTVAAKDPRVNAVVQRFWDNRQNKMALTSHQALVQKEVDLQVVGNIFFVLFSNISTGAVSIRTIRTEEFQQVISNPDDAMEPWFYKREWTEHSLDEASGETHDEPRKALYPDWAYNPTTKPTKLYGMAVEWATPIYHIKVGGLSDMTMGIPETYAAHEWVMSYSDFLKDWLTITKAYARFAFLFETAGGQRGVDKVKTKLGTTVASGANSASIESNPPPNVGSTFIHGENTKLAPFKTAGATTSADDGRRVLLMVACAMGLPETFFGDADVGNHATSKTLDRPTELKFKTRQSLWAEALRDLLDYVIDRAAISENGPLHGMALVKNLSSADELESDIPLTSDPQAGEAVDSFVSVDFPELLEHDVAEQVNAIVSAANLNGYPLAGTIDLKTLSRMLLTALGATEIDELHEIMFPEGEEPITGKPQPDAVRLAAPSSGLPDDGNPTTPPNLSVNDNLARSATAVEAQYLRSAARELREAIKKFHGRRAA